MTTGTALNTLSESVVIEEKKNTYLKERLKYVKTDKFIEEEAQEKLGMLREGEFFVIAPTAQPLNLQRIDLDNTPNWKKWLELFF
jgi:cell division protein FtsB